mgnify:CR=1 FL=1
MKKILIMLLVCILLTGCGDKDKSESKKESKNITVERKENTKKESKTSSDAKNTTTVKNESTTTKVKTYNKTTTKVITTTTMATTKSCTPKKFNQKYSYVYTTFEECKKEGNNAFFYITDNVDNRVFSYNCSAITDECGSTWYGVYFYIWENDREKILYY